MWIKKEYWQMTVRQKEAMLAAGIKLELERHHAAGCATVHGSHKGTLWLYPDGILFREASKPTKLLKKKAHNCKWAFKSGVIGRTQLLC